MRPSAVVVLAAVAAVGEVAGDGLALRLRGGSGVAGVRLDVGEDGPQLPRFDAWPRCASALDRPADFLPRFLEAAELPQSPMARPLRRFAFGRSVADFGVLVRSLAVKGRGFLMATRNILIQDPQLPERARLPGDISEPHLDGERFAVGILRRFRLARLADRPCRSGASHGDGARFVQLREALARFVMRLQRLRVAALQHADGPKLAFAHGNLPGVIELLGAADALFVGRRRFVEPAQVAETVALFRETDGRHPFRGLVGLLLGHGLEALAGLVQQRQGLFRAAGRPQHTGQEETSHRQIVIGAGIRLLARRPGTLEQSLRALEGLAQSPAGKLLIDAGPRRLEAA